MLRWWFARCSAAGQHKKIGRRGGTPQGRLHTPMLANQLIPTVEGEIKHARVGGGCIAILRVGGGTSDLLPRSKKLQVTWNLALFFDS
jgi:hypothetical protein